MVKESLINRKFYKWTIIEEIERDKQDHRQYKALCDCGSIKIGRLDSFKNGTSTQCRNCSNKKFKQYVPDEKVGKWTIMRKILNKFGEAFYLCKCECGTEKEIRRRDLLRGKSTQCVSCHISDKNRTHNHSGSPTYRIWAGLKQRCNNPKSKSFFYYGARGITLCEHWNLFENFFEDMGMRPDGMELDRIDPDGNYESSNCRWVTPKENKNNRRCSSKYRDKYVYVKKSNLCEKCILKI